MLSDYIATGRGVLLAAAWVVGTGCSAGSSDRVDSVDASIESMESSDAQVLGEMADASMALEPNQVLTATGPVQGEKDGETYVFRGIPYAAPPVGDLRFARPAPVDSWADMKVVTDYGKRCAQLESTTLQNAASEDEDCLTLNVWTPDTRAADKKATMVWIHGGGNRNGSASEPVPYSGAGYFYDGRRLAEEQDVVVVTFNYRLGVFGFLGHDEGSDFIGNQGLWDQQAVLMWVQKNIEAFGGDPDRVTIFGESAGSLDVCLHVSSPKSRGLFHRAISQSGGCTTGSATADSGRRLAAALSTELGCDGESGGMLDCLRGKSVEQLLAVNAADLVDGAAFGVVVDGQFLPEQPRALFDRGDIADVPYLLGSNSDEGTLFVPMSGYDDEQAYLDALSRTYGPVADKVAEQYPYADFEGAKPSAGVAALARAMGDGRLVCSTFDSAVRAQQAGRPVYMYNFDIAVQIPGSDLQLGATHGAELTYVFGTSGAFDDEAWAASQLIQRYWANFAKTGDPNGSGDLSWPKFGSAPDRRMNLAKSPTVVDNFRTELCQFWQGVYALSAPSAE